MGKIESMFLKSHKRSIKELELIIPKWEVGDKVRVLKNLDINVSEVIDFLGKFCIVISVNKRAGIFTPSQIEYQLKLGDRTEPFNEDELDARIKSNSNIKLKGKYEKQTK